MLAATSPTPAPAQEEPAVAAIIAQNLRAARVADASADLGLVLSEETGRVRVMTGVTRTKLAANGIDNMRIVWLRSPADVRGMAALTIVHAARLADILIYRPTGKKFEHLSSENAKDSYLGTDFSYADIIGFTPGEWRYQLVRRQAVNDHEDYIVVAVPVSDAVQKQTGYAKRMEWIRADNFIIEKSQLYDVSDKLLKIVTASDIRPVDDAKTRWQPMRLEARNAVGGRTTVMKFENYTVNIGLTAEQFSERALEYGP